MAEAKYQTKIDIMKIILIVVLLHIGLYSQAQDPFKNKQWSTNTLIGFSNFKFDPKLPEIILDTLNHKYPYGYITRFSADHTFTSYNMGPCGNECRISIKGTYTLNEHRIELVVDSISYWKECSHKPVEKYNTSLGWYVWKQKDSTIVLTRESIKQ